MFQLPALALSVVIASIEAALFFTWQGKSVRDLAAYWVAGVLGFLGGQAIAAALDLTILMIGQIHLLEGILVCAAALFVVKLLKV